MRSWKVCLWTPGNSPAFDGETFGCASYGVAARGIWNGPQEPGVVVAPVRFAGEVVAGRYADVLERLPHAAFAPQAAVVLFSRGLGAEHFLERWQGLFPAIPVAGGAAARGAGQECGELLPAAEDVAVLLLANGPWRAETLNVHNTVGPAWEFRAAGPRTIARLRRSGGGEWEPAAAVFRARQAESGRGHEDCESITLSDVNGRNLHCSFAGESLETGADLPADGRLRLRAVSRAAVTEKLKRFCTEPNALVFGCAGLRGLLDAPFATGDNSLAGFMFGELVTLAGRPQFGNLMAARLARQEPPPPASGGA